MVLEEVTTFTYNEKQQLVAQLFAPEEIEESTKSPQTSPQTSPRGEESDI